MLGAPELNIELNLAYSQGGPTTFAILPMSYFRASFIRIDSLKNEVYLPAYQLGGQLIGGSSCGRSYRLKNVSGCWWWANQPTRKLAVPNWEWTLCTQPPLTSMSWLTVPAPTESHESHSANVNSWIAEHHCQQELCSTDMWTNSHKNQRIYRWLLVITNPCHPLLNP